MEPVSRKRPLAAAEGPDPEQLLADTDSELGDSPPQGKRPRDRRSACPPTTAAAPPGLTLLLVQWSLCWLVGWLGLSYGWLLLALVPWWLLLAQVQSHQIRLINSSNTICTN